MGKPSGGPVEPDDAELIERVRRGDRVAYGLLYRRHAPTATRFARSLVATDADADDVVADVFASILAAIDNGRGPVDSFLPYLMRSVRHECYRTNRVSTREPVGHLRSADEAAASEASPVDPFASLAEAAVVRDAFRTLPTNFRSVLWQTEVDEVTPREIAAGTSTTPHAVAVMAQRARHALGSAYLNEHMTPPPPDRQVGEPCRLTREQLAKFVRGGVTPRRRRRLQEHLQTCQTCRDERDALGRLNTHLRVKPFMPAEVGAITAGSLGIKAQVLSWLTVSAAPMATSGMLAAALLAPTTAVPVEATSTPSPSIVIDAADAGPTDHTGPQRVVNDATPPARSSFATYDAGVVGRDPTPGIAHPHPATPMTMTAADPDPRLLAAAVLDDRAASGPTATYSSTTTSPTVPSTSSPQTDANGNAATPPGQTHATGNAGTPPGQTHANGIAGTPLGQTHANGNGNGNAGTPPGQANATGNAATPPGQTNANGNTATPPGQTNPNGNTATPPGQTNANGNTATPPGQTNPNGNAGTPPGQTQSALEDDVDVPAVRDVAPDDASTS